MRMRLLRKEYKDVCESIPYDPISQTHININSNRLLYIYHRTNKNCMCILESSECFEEKRNLERCPLCRDYCIVFREIDLEEYEFKKFNDYLDDMSYSLHYIITHIYYTYLVIKYPNNPYKDPIKTFKKRCHEILQRTFMKKKRIIKAQSIVRMFLCRQKYLQITKYVKPMLENMIKRDMYSIIMDKLKSSHVFSIFPEKTYMGFIVFEDEKKVILNTGIYLEINKEDITWYKM